MTNLTMGDFVYTSQDSTPAKIVLSVPHDGLWAHNFTGHFNPRDEGVGWADRHVTPIANDILIHCRAHGLTVDLVRFLMPRTYVDANRPAPGMTACDRYAETAFVDERVRPYYERYFSELGASIQRGIHCHGAEKILVLDLHGFARNRQYNKVTDFDVILGTDHRKTIRHGEPDKLLGHHLIENEFETFVPSESETLPNGDPFPGGFICEFLSDVHKVNVIQVEMEKKFRLKDSEMEGRRLALAIGKWLVEAY